MAATKISQLHDSRLFPPFGVVFQTGFFFSFPPCTSTANAATAAAAAAVLHVSAAAASALRNEPVEGAVGGEDAHPASRH